MANLVPVNFRKTKPEWLLARAAMVPELSIKTPTSRRGGRRLVLEIQGSACRAAALAMSDRARLATADLGGKGKEGGEGSAGN